MIRRLLMLSTLLGFACGGSGRAPGAGQPDSGIQGPDAGAGDAGVATAGCAAATLEGCDYIPAPSERFEQAPVRTMMLEYMDATQEMRVFSVALHVPMGAPVPMPVVVWSHGGNDGQNDATHVGTEWAQVFTSAGYAVVSIAHAPRTMVSTAKLCDALGYDAAGCLMFKHLHWDRPHDARRVFDFIEEQAASGPFAGKIDKDHVVYAGHSAGSGGTLMINGAPRDFAGTATVVSDPRPIAFISASPQGPGDEGFTEASFAEIVRPTLVLSGVGDDTEVAVGENRMRCFDFMQPGDKYRLYILEEAARHTTFDFNGDACMEYSMRNGLDAARCETYRLWLASAALAFLDAQVRGSATARAYLASDDLSVLSAGVGVWSRR